MAKVSKKSKSNQFTYIQPLKSSKFQTIDEQFNTLVSLISFKNWLLNYNNKDIININYLKIENDSQDLFSQYFRNMAEIISLNNDLQIYDFNVKYSSKIFKNNFLVLKVELTLEFFNGETVQFDLSPKNIELFKTISRSVTEWVKVMKKYHISETELIQTVLTTNWGKEYYLYKAMKKALSDVNDFTEWASNINGIIGVANSINDCPISNFIKSVPLKLEEELNNSLNISNLKTLKTVVNNDGIGAMFEDDKTKNKFYIFLELKDVPKWIISLTKKIDDSGIDVVKVNDIFKFL